MLLELIKYPHLKSHAQEKMDRQLTKLAHPEYFEKRAVTTDDLTLF